MCADRTGPLEEENAGTGTAMTGPLEEENTGTRTAMTRPLEEENAGTGTARLGPDRDPVIQGTLDEMNLGPLSDYLQHLDFPRGIAIHVLTRVTMFLLLPFHERGGTSMSEPAVIFGSDDQFTLSSTLEPGPGMDDMLLDGQVDAPWFTAITWRPVPVPRPPPPKMPLPKWPVPKWPPAGLGLQAPPLPKQVRPKQPPPLPRFQ